MGKRDHEIVAGGCLGLLVTFVLLLIFCTAVLFFGLDTVLHLENKRAIIVGIMALSVFILYWHYPGMWSFGLSDAGITVYFCGLKRRIVPWEQVEKASLTTQQYRWNSQTSCIVLLKGVPDDHVSLSKPRSFWRRNRKTSLYILNMGNNERFVKDLEPFLRKYYADRPRP